MTNEIVLANAPMNVDELQRIGKMLAMSGYFERSSDPTVAIAQMCTKVLAGRELGFGPFASVNGIHLIKGKPSVGANMMASAVKANPRYDYRVREMTNEVCTIEFFEIVDGKRESVGVSSFTVADARKAGTQNMDKFPRNMLFNRAMSNGVRWYCPDVFSGNTVYVPEELGADTDADGEPSGYRVVDISTGEIVEPNGAAPADVNFGMADVPAMPGGQPEPKPTNGKAQPAQLASAATLKRLNTQGREFYGNAWDAKRHELVAELGKRRTPPASITSSKDLTEAEALFLADGISKRITGRNMERAGQEYIDAHSAGPDDNAAEDEAALAELRFGS